MTNQPRPTPSAAAMQCAKAMERFIEVTADDPKRPFIYKGFRTEAAAGYLNRATEQAVAEATKELRTSVDAERLLTDHFHSVVCGVDGLLQMCREHFIEAPAMGEWARHCLSAQLKIKHVCEERDAARALLQRHTPLHGKGTT